MHSAALLRTLRIISWLDPDALGVSDPSAPLLSLSRRKPKEAEECERGWIWRIRTRPSTSGDALGSGEAKARVKYLAVPCDRTFGGPMSSVADRPVHAFGHLCETLEGGVEAFDRV